jgi:hypothetical protein
MQAAGQAEAKTEWQRSQESVTNQAKAAVVGMDIAAAWKSAVKGGLPEVAQSQVFEVHLHGLAGLRDALVQSVGEEVTTSESSRTVGSALERWEAKNVGRRWVVSDLLQEAGHGGTSDANERVKARVASSLALVGLCLERAARAFLRSHLVPELRTEVEANSILTNERSGQCI